MKFLKFLKEPKINSQVQCNKKPSTVTTQEIHQQIAEEKRKRRLINKCNNHNIDFNYDEKYDILYIKFGSTSMSYGENIKDDIILMKDIETEYLNGITIMNYKKNRGKLFYEDNKICRFENK